MLFYIDFSDVRHRNTKRDLGNFFVICAVRI